MKQIICDRCKININLVQFWTVVGSILTGTKRLDLCDKCYKDFKKWMNIQ